jgi:hypothetical protein
MLAVGNPPHNFLLDITLAATSFPMHLPCTTSPSNLLLRRQNAGPKNVHMLVLGAQYPIGFCQVHRAILSHNTFLSTLCAPCLARKARKLQAKSPRPKNCSVAFQSRLPRCSSTPKLCHKLPCHIPMNSSGTGTWSKRKSQSNPRNIYP